MFTLKGCDFITNKYPGVGGLDGMSSGVVSSPVAGSNPKVVLVCTHTNTPSPPAISESYLR